jgi:uncharacterized protein
MATNIINGINIKKHLIESEEYRRIEVDISEDDINAFISIVYTKPEATENNKDENSEESVKLYTARELKEALGKMKIVYGIIDESIEKCTKEKVIINLLIARGVAPEDDKEDEIKVNFQEKTANEFKTDAHGRVDFRSVGSVSTVNKGDIIAEKVIGKIGTDGIDVYGNERIRKKKKKVFLKACDGCILKEENSIEATISGEPYAKGNSFYVYGVHTLNKDVSLATGDIKFIGDIKIFGNVQEGMTVEAGN